MFCKLLNLAHACTHIHTHSFVAENPVDWFVRKPMTVHPFLESPFSVHLFSVLFSISEFPCCLCSPVYFLSIRKKKPLFLPPQARDDDGLGGKLPQHSFTQDTPRLVFKTNSDVLVRTITI